MDAEIIKNKIIRTQVVDYETDLGGYLIYIFKILDEEDKKLLNSNYWMCVQFPNWEHRLLKKGEIGYLAFKIIEAGDRYFNGVDFVQYRYSNIQFLKFIAESKNEVDINNI